jgi:uncharacterized protein
LDLPDFEKEQNLVNFGINVRSQIVTVSAAAIAAAVVVAPAYSVAQNSAYAVSGHFDFQPLPSSAVCTAPRGNPTQPFVLPPGFAQSIVASEPAFPDLTDMNTLNETGSHSGRYLYRAHEVGSNGSVTVTDLQTGLSRVLALRSDWERLDGIAWTPWGTIVTAEETSNAAFRDPAVPQAQAGLVYEIDPQTGATTPRPAVGSRSHEGLRFDSRGNFYGISETNPGYIYRFVPDRRGDLTSGQLYALKIVAATGDRTGEAVWLPLDRTAVQVNSDAAAAAAGATGYSRPEDVETGTSTGNNRGGTNVLYVAITAEDRVLRVDLQQSGGGSEHSTAYVSEYVRAGVNAPVDFDMPDNLALDKNGNLYIAEDPGGSFPVKTTGDDIWVATPSSGNNGIAEEAVRFASLTDCDAEPTGIYFDLSGGTLYVNAQHRSGDGRDLAIAITQDR